MTNIWAMFAVVFLAIYTANLAAFMITREEFHEFTGLDDPRLQKPLTHKPMIRFGSVPFTHTDSTIQRYFKEMHAYISQYNKSTVKDGVDAVINRELDAFIYDGTVLDYMAEQDEGCRLLTVGTWYAKTGYGLAFTRKSKYLQMFNRKLLEFRENGDLERLRRYWMTGACLPGKDSGNKSSDPLAMEQFLSAFVLLMFGILLAFTLLGFENGYFRFAKKRMYKKSKKPCCCGCCSLISVSMGKILESEFEEYQTQIRKNNSFSCRNKGCAFYVQELEKYLDKSQIRIRYLEMELNRNGIKIPP
ncbi:hypothetical protein V9T40_002236 [Parthenolecanium corni]|uniref:Ionotropic glutamate receptor C-terminal domain-containing protein n=1 Tax=Parthenolecanium corni TaxID=536013 RepID=A0AAN9TFW7_9HEMI